MYQILQICRVLASILAGAFVLGSFAKSADEEGFKGDPELLKLASVQCRVNVESLMTWRGTVNVVENKTEASGQESRYSSTIDFAYDRALDAKRWRWNCHEFVTIKDGKEQPTEIGLMSGMIKDNVYYRLGPIANSYQGRKVVVIHGESKFHFGPESVDFDPMYCFTDLGQPAFARFDSLYRMAKKGGAKSWRVSRSGDVISLISESVMPGGGAVMNHFEVAASQGSNIVSYKSTDPWAELQYDYEYVNVSSIWVPAKHTYQRSGRGTTYRRTMEWTQNVVNEPSDPALFTIESLGVTDGDRVKDSRSGTDYTIGGREAAKKAALARSGKVAPQPPAKWSRFAMFAACVSILLLFVSYKAFMHRRPGQKAE